MTEELHHSRSELEEQADLALIDLYDITAELDRRRRRFSHVLGPVALISGVVVLVLAARGMRGKTNHQDNSSRHRSMLSGAPLWEGALTLGVMVALRKWKSSHTHDSAEAEMRPVRQLGSGRPS